MSHNAGVRITLHIFVAALMALSLGCLNQDSGSGSESGTEVDWEPTPTTQDPATFVCNPFEPNPDGLDESSGILGSLYYLTEDQPQYEFVDDYFEFGHHIADIDIYLNQLFIPTRPFDRGFTTQAGQTLKALDGSTLYEWFALRFTGKLKLGPLDYEGPYQVAILSDDGAILSFKNASGDYEEFINNDEFHPTKMACGAAPLAINQGDELEFELKYFQGPRYHISLIVMWRPWSEVASDRDEPLCGELGNNLFFDYRADPVVPNQAYLDLLERGWRPLEPENFVLPGERENPCNEPAPVISGTSVVEVTRSGAKVTWSTDIPSTSQVLYTNLSTGEQLATTIDMNMVTSHSVLIGGLDPLTSYSIRAYSASSSGRTTESEEVTFRTLR